MSTAIATRRQRLVLPETLVRANRDVPTGVWGGVNSEYILNRPSEQVFAIGNGLGLDSMGMMILCRDIGLRPQFVTFADVGDHTADGKPGEKPQTYAYIPVLREWLRKNGFPDLIVVRKITTNRVTYTTLYENGVVNQTLPSLAFGMKGCSIKWKIVPQEQFLARQPSVIRGWQAGYKIIKAIGYDAGPADMRRSGKIEDERYVYWYPLREFGWTRDIIREKVVAEGLPGWNADNEQTGELRWVESGGVPVKSACFFCPASKKWEVDRLAQYNPDLADKAIVMEKGARDGKNGLGTTVGLGRTWSWEKYGKEKGFKLPVLAEQPTAMCEACDD